MTPTQRTLRHLYDQGFRSEVVEKWVRNPKHPAGGFRKDFMSIIDILSLTPTGVMGVQSTGQDFYGHRSAMMNDEKKRQACIDWLNTPGTRLTLYGWKATVKGKRKTWTPKIQELFIADFSGYSLEFTHSESAPHESDE